MVGEKVVEEKDKKIGSYCRKCLGERNHSILFEKVDSTSWPEEGISFSYKYMVLTCSGCETVSYRTDYDDIDNREYSDDGTYENYTDTQIYPPVIKRHQRLKKAYKLPSQIRTIYDECILCISLDCKILAAAAFRAIIESVCLHQKVSGKDLKEKIKNLEKEGLISKNEMKRLHSIRFMGNDAVHRLESVKADAIMLVLKIVEHLLESLYLLPLEGEGLLEFTIDNIEDLKKLIRICIRKNNFTGPVSLQELLGKSFRRIEDHAEILEKQLIEDIKGKRSIKPL